MTSNQSLIFILPNPTFKNFLCYVFYISKWPKKCYNSIQNVLKTDTQPAQRHKDLRSVDFIVGKKEILTLYVQLWFLFILNV